MNKNHLHIRMLHLVALAGLLLSIPVWAQERQLMEISSEKLYDGSIKVLFILSEVNNPKMFYYKTPSAPKVVCDFFNVKVKPGLKQEIRVDKRYIRNVRLGEHHDPKDKVRVVLDLIPGKKYSVKEVPPEPNIFSVILRSDDITSDTNESIINETTINETTIEDTQSQQINMTTQTETTRETTITTTIPEISEQEVVDENDEKTSDDNNMNRANDKDLEENLDDTDDVFSEENDWIEKLIDANSDLQAPNKWPVQKSFGPLKLIVHLDTDPNGFIALKGYAINMSDVFLYRIQLDFDIFNDNADVIEQAHAEFFNVEPGERRKLNVHVGVKTASNFRLMQQLFW